jgi:hypothetical protein
MDIQTFHCISKAIYGDGDYYKDLGVIELSDDSTLETLKVVVTPHEGFHKDISYTITCKFKELAISSAVTLVLNV